MITEAIKHIEQNTHGQPVLIGGRQYTTRAVHPTLEPMPTPIILFTLQGVVDFINSEQPGGAGGAFVHVAGPRDVSVRGPIIGQFAQRPMFANAKWEQGQFRFGQFMDQEKFIIDMNSLFVPTEQSAEILAFVSGLQDNSSAKIRDDGVRQTTTVKKGVASLVETGIKNPVVLRPYRTFAEVPQPEGLFVFRMVRREDQPPHCALFDADGGMWQVAAMTSIKQWFNDKLPSVNVVM